MSTLTLLSIALSTVAAVLLVLGIRWEIRKTDREAAVEQLRHVHRSEQDEALSRDGRPWPRENDPWDAALRKLVEHGADAGALTARDAVLFAAGAVALLVLLCGCGLAVLG